MFPTNIIRLLGWLVLITIVVLTLAPPVFRPETAAPHNIEHAGIFLLAGIAFGMGYPGREWWLYAGAIVFCAGLEVAQLFDPGRHARVSDFFVDAIASGAGIYVGSVLHKMGLTRP